MSNSSNSSNIHAQSSVLEPALPQAADKPLFWSRLYGSSRGLALVQAARHHPGPLLLVTADARAAQLCLDALHFYAQGGEALPLLAFPDWECLPYDVFSPHQELISQRLLTLHQLPQLKRGIVVAPIAAALQRLAPASYIAAHSFLLRQGEPIDIEALRGQLGLAGYQSVSQVMEPGEFALRGGVIDLFPMGSHVPYRLDLFDNEIESIRVFDPNSQRSNERLEHIALLPAREFPLDEAAISRFRQAFRARFEGDPQQVSLYRDISQGLAPAGIEFYLPLFYKHTATLFDYLPANSLCVMDQGTRQALTHFARDTDERYEQLRYDRERPVLAPQELYLDSDTWLTQWQGHRHIEMLASREDETPVPENRCVRFACDTPATLPVTPHSDTPYSALFDYLEHYSGRVLLVAETLGRRETLRAMLQEHDIFPELVSDWRQFIDGDMRLGLTVAEIDKGLLLPQPPVAVITESQLFGERAAQRRRRQRGREPEAVIRSLAELKGGDPVVHEDHGVGRYLGLQTLDVGDGATEFLTLEYAGGDKLYIPVVSLHLISRYTGTDSEHAPLHKLGSEAWDKAKRRAQQKAHDAAAELLEIYALRAARQGHAFAFDDGHYANFAAQFPFEETPDQARAIEEVRQDMVASKPMDRLICGDVGFGKTEVALRAAYIAVEGGAQVVVLVPTTLLAQQHYQNFSDRFAEFPVKLALLSRFRSKSEQAETLEALQKGKVDIVIGTHRLLQSDIRFDNLGLVIIDEEHRFGVRQKERLKQLRSEVDILNLTATPIPRTLNMAMAGLRDISIIATAPEQRLSIKTFVHEDNKALMREACLREIRRGGQVYFLHNEVRTIDKAVHELQELVPEAEIHMAHGQMPELQLEQIMLDFYHQRFNILVCSTIIESGIDIPSANTIIIQRADKFGLAQLHQLRGRVGRSHRRAYAYLLIPSRKTITVEARKRLDAIASLEDLGAGFALASHDLEIRGAGELLGESQSGEINEVGFSMYAELLERAVQSLRAGKSISFDSSHHSGSEINIHAPALLPEGYLPDVHMRLVQYKRIANAKTAEGLKQLEEEMIDRFGLLPEAGHLLFQVTALKILASPLGIHKIDAGPKGARIDFEQQPPIDPGKIIQLLQSEPRRYQLDGPSRVRIKHDMPTPEDRIKTLRQVLEQLSEPD